VITERGVTKPIVVERKTPSKSYKLLLNVIIASIVMFATIILAIMVFLVIPLILGTSIFKIFSMSDIEWPYYVATVIIFFMLIILSFLYIRKNIKALSESIDGRIIQKGSISNGLQPLEDEDFLKYLDDGEKRIYLMIRNYGGPVLQKDLVGIDGYSAATISRILDKLERKGLIEKIRSGSTYRIILKSNSK
jgi:DNA-binding transcriptional ArsR family regulator